MTLSEKYVVTSDIDTYFVNKDTGQPLSNGTVRFFRDSVRNVTKDVYQLSGAPPTYDYVSLGSTVTLSNSGNVQDANSNNIVLYYNPYAIDPGSGLEVVDLYYIECYDQNGVLQFTREAWPNVPDDSSSTSTGKEDFSNQLSNPQFTNVFLSEGVSSVVNYTSAVKKVVPIAPNWDLIVTGTGSITLTREKLNGNLNVKTNPPYALRIVTSTGITQCLLNQRFYKNSGLWTAATGQNIYLCGSFLARNNLNAPTNMIMYYSEPTPGYVAVPIFTGSFQSLFVLSSGCSAGTIPVSTNNTTSDYVDIYVDIPVNRDISVTSLNVYPSLVTTTSPSISLDSSNRNQAYQGDWYIPRLSRKTTNSYLTGWDFVVNPSQFRNPTAMFVGSSTAEYLIDQTIMQTGTKAMRADLNFVTSGLSFSSQSNQPFFSCALIQYLSGYQVDTMLQNGLSCNINAKLSSVQAANCTARVYLFRRSSTGFPVLPTTIGTLDDQGVFTLTASGWSEIPRNTGPAIATVKTKVSGDPDDSGNYDYGFSGWSEVTGVLSSNQFAIVVTFYSVAIPPSLGSSIVTVYSICLSAGEIPCRPNPTTPSDTLFQCQYYYQKSFLTGIPPSQNAGLNTGYLINNQVVGQNTSVSAFNVRLPCEMRRQPVITLYNPNALNSQIRNISDSTDWSGTTAILPTPIGFTVQGTSPASSDGTKLCAIHYTADARIGL
jgi:hypothetical protein